MEEASRNMSSSAWGAGVTVGEFYNQHIRELMSNRAIRAEIDQAYGASVVTGTGMSIGYWDKDGPEVRVVEPFASRLTQIMEAREDATQAERSRILAALEKIAPGETQYTRRDWAIEEKGARAMYAKVLKAIGGVAKEGE